MCQQQKWRQMHAHRVSYGVNVSTEIPFAFCRANAMQIGVSVIYLWARHRPVLLALSGASVLTGIPCVSPLLSETKIGGVVDCR